MSFDTVAPPITLKCSEDLAVVVWQLLAVGVTFPQPLWVRPTVPTTSGDLNGLGSRLLAMAVFSRHYEHRKNSWHCCHLQGSSCICGNREMLLLASPGAAAWSKHQGTTHDLSITNGSQSQAMKCLTPGVELASCLFLSAWCRYCWLLAQTASPDSLHGCFRMPSLGVSDSELSSVL